MIADFVIKLMAGIAIMWCLMPRRDVTDGFLKIQMRVVLGLAVLASLLLMSRGKPEPVRAVETGDSTAVESSAETDSVGSAIQAAGKLQHHLIYVCVAVAVVCYAGSVFWAIGRRGPGNVSVWMVGILTTLILVVRSLYVQRFTDTVQPIGRPLQVFADSGSAVLLGSIVTAMLLGHWYLTSPTMSVRPLMWLNVVIAGAVVLRGMASVIVSLSAHPDLSDPTVVTWLALRWLGAIVAPAAVVVMVWRIMKYRNTQSATGVLFAGVIMVFMGEMAAALLQRQVGAPL